MSSASASAHQAAEAVRSLRAMRETLYCAPPGHSWSPGKARAGDRCQCGETVMDADVRRALDWRCEP